MRIRKSWIFTAIFAVGCATISAGVNWLGGSANEGGPPFPPMAWLHIGSAFFGALCLARFVIGSPAAMAGPAPGHVRVESSTSLSRHKDENATYASRISGKSAFFSPIRGAQLVAILLCLMLQFVIVQAPGAPSDSDGGSIINAHPHSGHPHRKVLTT